MSANPNDLSRQLYQVDAADTLIRELREAKAAGQAGELTAEIGRFIRNATCPGKEEELQKAMMLGGDAIELLDTVEKAKKYETVFEEEGVALEEMRGVRRAVDKYIEEDEAKSEIRLGNLEKTLKEKAKLERELEKQKVELEQQKVEWRQKFTKQEEQRQRMAENAERLEMLRAQQSHEQAAAEKEMTALKQELERKEKEVDEWIVRLEDERQARQKDKVVGDKAYANLLKEKQDEVEKVLNDERNRVQFLERERVELIERLEEAIEGRNDARSHIEHLETTLKEERLQRIAAINKTEKLAIDLQEVHQSLALAEQKHNSAHKRAEEAEERELRATSELQEQRREHEEEIKRVLEEKDGVVGSLRRRLEESEHRTSAAERDKTVLKLESKASSAKAVIATTEATKAKRALEDERYLHRQELARSEQQIQVVDAAARKLGEQMATMTLGQATVQEAYEAPKGTKRVAEDAAIEDDPGFTTMVDDDNNVVRSLALGDAEPGTETPHQQAIQQTLPDDGGPEQLAEQTETVIEEEQPHEEKEADSGPEEPEDTIMTEQEDTNMTVQEDAQGIFASEAVKSSRWWNDLVNPNYERSWRALKGENEDERCVPCEIQRCKCEWDDGPHKACGKCKSKSTARPKTKYGCWSWRKDGNHEYHPREE